MARRLTLLAAAIACSWPGVAMAQGGAELLAWEPVPAAEVIDPAQELANTQGQAQPPASQAEAEALVDSLWPSWDDYPPMLRLGPGLPTANLLPAWELDLSLQAISPLAGGGDATGSGNQNIGARLDLGLSDSLQVSVFSFIADDPLFAQPVNKSPNPQNGWSAEGGAVQWQMLRNANWSLALAGSLEAFNVRSGGCGNDGVGNCSPNIFNDSGAGVSTDNLVGSLAVPLTWKASRALELTLVPGVSFLPSSQGAGQGGSGTFFGTNVTLGAGAVWRASTQLSLFGSALLPLGPGTNSFDANLNFSRVPIFSGGLRYALNPRMGIEAMLTNGFGGSPATAVLSLPSSNEPLWSARVSWNPGGKDSPPLPFTARSRSLSLGGLTVTTAVVPPAGSFQLWANADSEGNRFGEVAYGLSNDFLLRLVGGAFNAVSPVTPLVPVYAGDDSSNLRLGGKAVLMQQLRGAPFSLALDVSYGRTSTTNQGYTFSQLVATWEANPWLAFNLNPKVSWNGVEVPFGIGLGANLQLGQSFQLIPELNLVTTEAGESNGTLALRWLARRTLAFDLYVSNAAGLLDIGQLLDSDDVRVGSKLTLQF